MVLDVPPEIIKIEQNAQAFIKSLNIKESAVFTKYMADSKEKTKVDLNQLSKGSKENIDKYTVYLYEHIPSSFNKNQRKEWIGIINKIRDFVHLQPLPKQNYMIWIIILLLILIGIFLFFKFK